MVNEAKNEELIRRHRIAAATVVTMLVITLALVAIVFFAGDRLPPLNSQASAMTLWIVILLFGMGAFVFRRNRFSAMRLKDIAAIKGISGLLKSLQSTTMMVAFIAGVVTILGVIITMMTRSKYDMLRAGGVSTIILLYCYPFRGAWERVVHGIERMGNANDPSTMGSTN